MHQYEGCTSEEPNRQWFPAGNATLKYPKMISIVGEATLVINPYGTSPMSPFL